MNYHNGNDQNTFIGRTDYMVHRTEHGHWVARSIFVTFAHMRFVALAHMYLPLRHY